MRYPQYRMPHHPSPTPRPMNPDSAYNHGQDAQASQGHDTAQSLHNSRDEFPSMQDTPDTALLIAMAMARGGGPCGARTLLHETFPMLDVPDRLQRAMRGNKQTMLDALSPMLSAHLRTLEQMERISQLASTLKAQLSNIDSGAGASAPNPPPAQESSRMNPMNMLNMLSALGGMNGNGGMGNMGNIANMAGMLGNMNGNNASGDSGSSGGSQMQMMEMLAKMMGNRNNGG